MLKPPAHNVPGMSDTLEFVKNLWGGMGVPGMTAPALSVEDLDKRITDLKTVESWLKLNLTMLHSTIQGLEVQRGTIATLKAMSDSMAQVLGQPGEQTAALPPFSAFFNAAGTQHAGSPPAPAPAQADTGAACAADATLPAAMAWWNLLQEQFRQAVANTLPGDAAQRDGGSAPTAAPPAPAAAAAAAATPGPAPAAPAAPATATPRSKPGKT